MSRSGDVYTQVSGKVVLTILMMLFATIASHADRIDDYVVEQMHIQHIPGLSMAIVKDGKVIRAKGYGFANLETRTLATPESVYEIASDTKQFTASAIMLLVQDGKLNLGDKISSYVDGTPESWKDITIQNLLTHTSGISDYLKDVLGSKAEEPDTDSTPREIVDMTANLPLKFAPGQSYNYCNTDYVLLAMVIQKVTGQSYDAFLAQKIFTPLGMTATRFDDPNLTNAKRVKGYDWNGTTWQNSAHLNPTLWNNGDGGLVSSVIDLAKWDAALNQNEILTSNSKKEMWSAAKLSDGSTYPYGFGWSIANMDQHRLVWHNGARPGTAVTMCRYLDDKYTIILAANTDNGNLEKIAFDLIGFYVRDLRTPPFNLSAVVAPITAAIGLPVTITVSAKDLGDSSPKVIVDMEVRDGSDKKIFQQSKTDEIFNHNETKTYTYVWTPTIAGTYSVKVGVFGLNWQLTDGWNNNAATIEVR